MSESIIDKLTLEDLRELIQLAGYRVETVTDPVANIPYLRSATNGLPFDIRPGNRLAADGQSFIDVALIAVLQVQGDLPLDLINRWNATRRFARLQLSPPFLALSLDFSLAGGVTQAHLRAQIEIWDHLVQQLIVFLREELAALAKARAPQVPVADPAVQPTAADRSRAVDTDAPRTVQ
jgi:Putative bacterial sensory transduction regulator